MKKLALNTIASLSNEIATIIMGFILPRLILVYFGSDVNGLVTSITQFLSFISLCEMGIGPVIKANLYKPLAEQDMYSTSCVMKSAQSFFRKIAIILVVYTAVLCFVYPSLVSDKFDFIFTATMVLIISISSFAQYYFGITYQLLLAANQQAYIQLFINCIAIVINTVACVVLMKMGATIHIVKLTSSILFAARPVCLLITLCGALRCIQMVYIIVIQGAGHFKETQIASFIEPVINIIISIIAVWKFGLIGVAIGTVVSLSYRLGYMVIYLKRHILFRNLSIVVKQLCIDILSAGLIVLGTSFLPRYASTYFGWILNAVLVSVVALGIFVVINMVFYRSNFVVLVNRLKKRIKSN